MTKKILFFAAILLSLFAVSTRADFTVERWRFKKSIAPPASAPRPTSGEVVFDIDILSGGRSDLRDIRIIRSDGVESPYVFATEAPASGRESHAVLIRDLGSVSGKYTSFIADLGRDGIIHNAVTIRTDSHNFRRQATVEGSHDAASWLTLGAKSIYDYAVEFAARDTAIPYTDATFRYLRVTIADNGEVPLKSLGAVVSRETAVAAREVAYEGAIVNRTDNADKRTNSVLFDMGTVGAPTNRLELQTTSANFNRVVALEGSSDKNAWEVVSYRDVLFSYDTPAFRGAKLVLSYPERAFRFFRLTIFNKDDAPIVLTKGTFFGYVRKAIFAHDPAYTYAVYYGNPDARRPEYDLANYLDYFDKDSRAALSLGAQADNPSYKKIEPPPVPFVEAHPWILFSALAFMVLVIGFLIFNLFRRTQRINQSPPLS